MKIGVNFGTTLYHYGPAEQVAVAQKAEACGFASLWSGDHLVIPAVMPLRDMAKPDMPIRKVDPKSPTAKVIFPATEPMPDVFITHAFMAAATTRLEFGTAIYILALRHPMASARAIGTLDLLSGGRVLVGVGLGWIPHEFELAGVDFASRGRRTEECVRIMKKLWTEEEPEYQGEFHSFGPARFEPKPATPGGPPIMIGGASDIALRRAAALGDGWGGRLHTPDTLRAHVAKLAELRREAGRDKLPFIIQGWLKPSATAADARALEDAGAHHLILGMHGFKTAAEAMAHIERAAENLRLN